MLSSSVSKMVCLEEFDIVMKNTSGVFYGGEPVYGQVTLQLHEPMKMKGIYIVLHGGCRVKFPDTKRLGTHFSDAETYFHKTATLFGKPKYDADGNENRKVTMHPAGNFRYPFRFELPRFSPTSFEGRHGRVRYWIRATIDRPVRFNLESEKIFTVISHLNLNNLADMMLPMAVTESRGSWFLSCNPWRLEGSLTLDQKGFVPGQYIHISGEVVNKSPHDMTNHRIELLQYVAYEAEQRSFKSVDVLDTLQKGKIPAGDTVGLQEMFLIPPLAPSHLIGCTKIDLRYILQLVIDKEHEPDFLRVPVEIIIGTRPLRDVMARFAETKDAMHNDASMRGFAYPESGSVVMPALPVVPSSLPAIRVSQDRDGSSLPLPSYIRSRFAQQNNTAESYIAENKDGDWVPTYVFFTWLPAQIEDDDKLLNVMLADFAKEKTFVLQREKTRKELINIPAGLKMLGDNISLK